MWPGEPVTLGIAGNLDTLDARIQAVPDAPAVFLIAPNEGAPYLARTSLLRRRLKRLLGERARASRLLNLRMVANRVEYWLAGSRLESALTHYRLAAQHFPGTYLDELKLRMPAYVKLMLANRFPRSQVTTRLSSGKGLHYGPFSSRAGAELFETQVLELFQMRRCQEDLEPSPEHPGCIYGEMNKCLRPCQLAVSAEEYAGEAGRVAAFLRSGGESLIEPLERARERLSLELLFEDAAREHKRIEKIQDVVRMAGPLVCDIERLHGVVVTPSVDTGAADLWFVIAGAWQDPVRFGFEAIEGKTVSMDRRLRDLVLSLEPERPSVQERQEHLALLARWYYSSWRDGDWIGFTDFEHLPYRKLVRAVSRQTVKPGEAPAASR